MAGIDEQFVNLAGNVSPGLRLWRIENFKPVPVPEEEIGTLYRGDSYIVLATVENKHGSLDHSIHFWLGSESSQDEKGVAARKTVELDDALGGAATQYREVEGHESSAFMSLFKSYGGVEYLDGGVDSGFNHVEPDQYETRLLHVKGKRNVRTRQVKVSIESMNKGDVFILDKGLKLFLWMGPECNKYEKAKGLQVLQRIYNSRGARPEQIVVNDAANADEFWNELGGSDADVAAATDDDNVEEHMGELKLYRVSDAEGELQVTEVEKKNGKLTKDMLDTNDTFILDTGAEIFAWIGKGATKQEKSNAMSHANEYIEKNNRPSFCRVTRVVENAETPVFKSLFYQWDPAPSFDFTHKSKGIATKIEQKEINASDLHKRQPAESEQMVDDGSGEVKVWILEDNEMSEYPQEKYGQFFGGDSYVVQYTYTDNHGSKAHLLYYWLGRQSSTMEKGSAAARVVELAKTLNEPSTHIRLVQGKEPPHFCAIFKGAMIVHRNGRNGEQEASSETRLYHVKGSNALNTKAVEVPASAENLNSGDCFVVVADANVYLWEGKGSNEEERAVAAKTAEILKGGSEHETIEEGNEPEEFWTALGGKADYPEAIPEEGAPQIARLFHVSDKTGALEVDEIFNFAQDDLMDDDVMILDTFSQVFVWIGSEANENEKSNGMKIAQEYIDAANDGRDPDTPIIEVQSGEEPQMFTCNFTGWDPAQAPKFVDPYQQRLEALKKEQEKKKAEEEKRLEEQAKARAEAVAKLEAEKKPAKSNDDEEKGSPQPVQTTRTSGGDELSFDNKLSLEELQAARPGGKYNLVWTSKEEYLSAEDFQNAFGMTIEEFKKLPKWKRVDKKKSLNIF